MNVACRHGETLGRIHSQIGHPEGGALHHDQTPVSILQVNVRDHPLMTSNPSAHHCGRVKEFLEDSLSTLGLDYVDLVRHHDMHG